MSDIPVLASMDCFFCLFSFHLRYSWFLIFHWNLSIWYYVQRLRFLWSRHLRWLSSTHSGKSRFSATLFMTDKSTSSGSTRPPWTHRWGGPTTPAEWGEGVLAPNMVSTDPVLERRSQMGLWALRLASCITCLGEDWRDTSLTAHERQRLSSPCSLCRCG